MATRREQALLVGGLLGGAAVMLLVAVVGFGLDLWGNTSSTITLRPEGQDGACAITGKETEITVGKNKKLTWKVVNHCPRVQTLAVGNFRDPNEVSVSVVDQCADPVLGKALSPFRQDALADRQVEIPARPPTNPRPGEKKLELKVKPRNGDGGLPDRELTYIFDICLEGKRVDPRLIVQR
jgi:hypothetical protein